MAPDKKAICNIFKLSIFPTKNIIINNMKYWGFGKEV
jgi:hypothetical protein